MISVKYKILSAKLRVKKIDQNFTILGVNGYLKRKYFYPNPGIGISHNT